MDRKINSKRSIKIYRDRTQREGATIRERKYRYISTQEKVRGVESKAYGKSLVSKVDGCKALARKEIVSWGTRKGKYL